MRKRKRKKKGKKGKERKGKARNGKEKIPEVDRKRCFSVSFIFSLCENQKTRKMLPPNPSMKKD